MKAARFHGIGEPLRLEERPVPDLAPHELLLAVRACGLCGSDVHIAEDGTTETAFLPITLGHEAAGVVERLGDAVSGPAPGTRVCVVPDMACGHCVNCVGGHSEICVSRRVLGIHMDGALAEYVAVPAANCVPVPDGVPFDEAAVITDAVATPYHALRVAHLRTGQSVLVLGVGGLGAHAVRLASLGGASPVIAAAGHASALARAAACGADAVIELSQDVVGRVRALTGGHGVDLAIDCHGSAASVATALDALRPGGRLVVVGLTPDNARFPVAVLVRRGLTVYGAYGATRNDVADLLQLCASGRLDLSRSITHRYPLDGVNDALARLRTKEGDPLRIVVEPALGGSGRAGRRKEVEPAVRV